MGKTIARMEDQVKTVKSQIKDLDGEIATTEQEMEKQLELRNNEEADFKQALKDDADAIQILSETMKVLSKFYKKNKIPLSFRQEPEYTVDPNKAPETTWSGSDYGGRKQESAGIIAIIGMLREDLQLEMKKGREEDAEAQSSYEKGRSAAKDMLD